VTDSISIRGRGAAAPQKKNTEGVKGRRSHPNRRNGREPRGRLSSSKIRVAWFELELAGKVTQMPGKKFVKSFWLLASGSKSERI
jgi:hypothetical protein